MTAIYGTLDIRRVGQNKFYLLEPVTFLLNDDSSTTVPAGFTYDSGSIPRLARPIVCPFGSPADFGFLLHDWYYHLDDNGCAPVTRLEADNAMFELHNYCGVSPFVAAGVYTAVRAASWMFWGNGTPDVPVDDDLNEYLDL